MKYNEDDNKSEFAGEHDVTRQRVNNRSSIVSRSYNLYSDVQRADDIMVTLPHDEAD